MGSMLRRLAVPVGATVFLLSWPLLRAYNLLVRRERTRVLLATKGGRVLLVRPWYGRGEWSLPGGGLHKRERPIDGAQRELMEETGIALGVDQLKPLGIDVVRGASGSYTCHYFYGEFQKPLKGGARLPEIIALHWVPISQLQAYRLGSDVPPALSAYNTLVQ